MGLRGPAPKPVEQRKAEGSYRKSKHGDVLVVGGKVSLAPKPPRGLPKGGAAVWRQIAEPLAEAGLLDTVDSLALEALVSCVVTWREAQKMIDQDGLVAVSEKGGVYQHPAVGIRNAAQKEFRAWCQRFGLTPSDRVGLGLQALRGKSMQQDMAQRIGKSPRQAA